jgi:SAM-dependent methyltransferase
MIYESLNQAVLHSIPVKSRRILDVGCGTGSLGSELKSGNEREVIGITFSSAEADLARAQLNQVLVVDLDSFVPTADLGQFDAIVCSHVLEHLREPKRLLSLLREHLVPGGSLVVALPNLLFWKQRVRLLRGNFKYTDGGLMDSTHLRFFDWDTARRLLTDSGFSLVNATAEGVCPLPVVRRVLPRCFAARLDATVTQLFPGLFGAQFVIVARVAGEEAKISASRVQQHQHT